MSAAIAAVAIAEDIIAPSPNIWEVYSLIYNELSISDMHLTVATTRSHDRECLGRGCSEQINLLPICFY